MCRPFDRDVPVFLTKCVLASHVTRQVKNSELPIVSIINSHMHQLVTSGLCNTMGTIAEEALGGLSAGIVGTIIGYPLDVVKTQLQTNRSSAGIVSTAVNIVRQEGMVSLYRGVAPPLLSLSILNTFTFASYTHFQHYYDSHRGKWDSRNALAGATCGPFAAIVSTVENLVKTQMQIDRGSAQRRYMSSWDCFQQIARMRLNGVPGLWLYTGHFVNTIREVAFLSTYFFVYEGLRTELACSSISPEIVIPVAGGLSGAIAWTVSFPLDCVRAGVQGRRDLLSHMSAGHVFMDLIRSKGLRGLYAGVTPSIVRAFLVSGTRFSAYETTLWILRGGRDMF